MHTQVKKTRFLTWAERAFRGDGHIVEGGQRLGEVEEDVDVLGRAVGGVLLQAVADHVAHRQVLQKKNHVI